MSKYIFGFGEIDKSRIATVGGKGANLGELSKIEGIHVPDGFCVSTDAFRELLEADEQLSSLIDRLNVLIPEDRKNIIEVSAIIRSLIEKIPVNERIEKEISNYLLKFDKKDAFAIRSSATAEDLPTASFAGQQDTYLNITGKESILKHINKCWASLFTERAVIYRIQHKFDHKKVYLSVVVQKMIFPQSAGIMFTADPVTFNRKVVSIDASFGLGEALVSGQVNPDIYKVHEAKPIDKKISTKKTGIYAKPGGGTKEQSINVSQQNDQTLSDEQILDLAHIGRTIESHFGRPQDIEWCLSDGVFYIVQSRPITTLFPIPAANDNENHVYVSVGHQQMMTDAMKPLALSIWTTRSKLVTAGGRLFVDLTMGLASPGRQNVLDVLGQSDPLIKDALESILDRGDFIKTVPSEDKPFTPIKSAKGMSADDILALVGNDKNLVNELIENSEKSLQSLRDKITDKSGSELFQVIFDDIDVMRKGVADTRMLSAITAAINAAVWINEKMNEWLGEKGVADVISLSVPNNVTSEMGLALLDVADAIRPYPDVIRFLQQTTSDNFLDELPKIRGGNETLGVITTFLNKYGMRCAGEIDITKARWIEKPLILVPLILTNIKNVEPGSSKRKFLEGEQLALKKREEIIHRLKQLPDGDVKSEEAKQMIDHVRNFAGYREYPKFAIVNRYFIYKQALMKEADKLVKSGVLREREDVFYLTLQEFNYVVNSKKVNYDLINERKDEFKVFGKLTPPRVLTSDGEAVAGKYRRENIPAGSIVGLPVSSGVVEGRARVILNMEDANLEEGDILVTTFTDPSWTPLFVSIKGLVAEVGGLMTHGAVVAREYGLPAVVGVENATKLIKDGQRIRVNGRDGYVEIL